MPGIGVIFHEGIATGAVSPDDVDRPLWVDNLSSESKATGYSKSSECSGIEPLQRPAGTDDIGSRADKITSIRYENRIIWEILKPKLQ